MSEVRAFETEGKKYQVKKPTIQEINSGDIEYSKAYYRYLMTGLPTQDEMEAMLRQRGLIQPIEVKTQVLRQKLQDVVEQKTKAETPEDKQKAKEALQDVQVEISTLDAERSQYFIHTAESRASEDKLTHLIWLTVQVETGEKVWPTIDALKNEPNKTLLTDAITCFTMLVSGLSDPLKEETLTPETATVS